MNTWNEHPVADALRDAIAKLDDAGVYDTRPQEQALLLWTKQKAPVSPRLLPGGDGYICDVCERTVSVGKSFNCDTCREALSDDNTPDNNV